MKHVISLGSHCCSRVFKTSAKQMSTSSSRSVTTQLTSSENSSGHDERLKSIRRIIPKLTSNLHKGQCGRIGVIGGSFEYTGAPYFSAISSLKMGADVIYVFCCQDAGPAIKSYSPDLIVHPCLDNKDALTKIEPWLERLHALVIGPGLGRDKDVHMNVAKIINHCKEKLSLPLIIDADGLYLIIEDVDLIKDYPGLVILTPNVVEFDRLSIKMSENDPMNIAKSLNAIILQKGSVDIIVNGMYSEKYDLSDELVTVCDVPGSNRRCGGQGDILTGCLAAMVGWLQIYLRQRFEFDFYRHSLEKVDENQRKDILALHNMVVYGACVVTRTCSRLTFEREGRGMTAINMINHINAAFTLNFGQ